MKKIKNNINYIIYTLLSFFILALAIIAYNNFLENKLTSMIYGTMEEVSVQQIQALQQEMESELATIKNIALIFQQTPDEEEWLERYLPMLLEVEKNTGFSTMFLSNVHGDAITSLGQEISVAHRSYLSDVLLGNTIISEPAISQVGNNYIFTIATPIYINNNEEVVGILGGTYSLSEFQNILLPIFQGEGCSYLLDSRGHVLVSDQNSLHFDVGQYGEPIHNGLGYNLLDISEEDLLNGLSEGKKISFKYEINGTDYNAYIEPLGINDWLMCTSIESSFINTHLNLVESSVYVISAFILTLFIIIIILYVKDTRTKTELLNKVAYYDELTGLMNVKKFKKVVQSILDENPEKKFCMMLGDIKEFRYINDNYGNKYGDSILKYMSKTLLKTCVYEHDLVARVANDLFVSFYDYHDHIGFDYDRLSQMKISMYKLTGLDIHYHIGLYVIEPGENDMDMIYGRVSNAHNFAKKDGNTQIIYDYDERVKDTVLRLRDIELKMEDALNNKEFQVYIQPKYYSHTQSLSGGEALVRWYDSSEDKMIYPNDFIPIFEQNGFIKQLDLYMLERTCEYIQLWKKEGLNIVPISINFSRKSFITRTLAQDIISIVNKYDVLPQEIEIEITESVLIDEQNHIVDIINELHEYGFTISMDDFASEYASLAFLAEHTVDVVKLDKGLIDHISDNLRSYALIEGIVKTLKGLGIQVVAEGVEHEDQYKVLCEIGCHIIQGYYFGRPEEASLFINKLNDIDLNKNNSDAIRNLHKRDDILNQFATLERGSVLCEYIPQSDLVSVFITHDDHTITTIERENYLKEFFNASYVHPDERDRLYPLFCQLTRQPGEHIIDARVDYDHSGYKHYRITFISIADKTGKVYRIIGRGVKREPSLKI